MKKPAFIPKPAEITREAIIVMGGALLAAFIIGNMPSVREWIKTQWGGARPPGLADQQPL